ncbi:MAG: hypothetical protein Q9202_001727 [Teloschistes flavicans]
MIVFFSLLNGGMMPKFGYYMPWYLVGSILALIGSALLYTVDVDTPIATIYGYTILIGIGIGSYVTAGFSIVPFLVAPHDINNAIGFMAIAQVVGGNIFLSMAGCMYQNYGHSKLLPFLTALSQQDISSVIAGTSNPVFQSLSPQLKEVVVEKITEVMRNIWAVMVAGSAINVVLGPLMGVGVRRWDVELEVGLGKKILAVPPAEKV